MLFLLFYLQAFEIKADENLVSVGAALKFSRRKKADEITPNEKQHDTKEIEHFL